MMKLLFSDVSQENIPLRVDWHKTTTETIPEHKHEFFEMIFIVSGKGIHEINSINYNMNPGDIFLVPPDCPHSFRKRKNAEIVNLIFNHTELPGWSPDLLMDSCNDLFRICNNDFRPGMMALNVDNRNRVFQDLHHLAKRQAESFPMKKLFCITKFFQLCQFLACQKNNASNSISLAETVANQIIDYMGKNYKAPLTIGAIAMHSGVSMRTLQRIFRQACQCSPLTFLNDLRLEKSTYLLQYTSLKITEIASETGFSDSNYFCKSFTHKYKQSPREYRKNINTRLPI